MGCTDTKELKETTPTRQIEQTEPPKENILRDVN